MPIAWTNIRIPRELHARLVRLAGELRWADDWSPGFQPKLPDEFADQGHIPLWFIVEKAVKELEDHRRRSRHRSRKKPKTDDPTKDVPQVVPTPDR